MIASNSLPVNPDPHIKLFSSKNNRLSGAGRIKNVTCFPAFSANTRDIPGLHFSSGAGRIKNVTCFPAFSANTRDICILYCRRPFSFERSGAPVASLLAGRLCSRLGRGFFSVLIRKP